VNPRLIIFDVFRTLVVPEPGFETTFEDGLRNRGVDPGPELLGELQAKSEGTVHAEVSVSRPSYVEWTTGVLDEVTRTGITAGIAPWVIPALEQFYQAPMRPLPGVVDVLADLRARGIGLAACSNWGWDLAEDLRGPGLLPLLDLVLPSARAGHRKPHPAIYRQVLAARGVRPEHAIFVGDSPTADVDGPQAVGVAAVHVDPLARPSRARWRIRDIARLPDLLDR
jgi:putative hydrolase of the HAD superfamily